jgi:FMN phosphatase YigB (HAD superfamily)
MKKGILHFDFDGVLYKCDDLTPLHRMCVEGMVDHGLNVEVDTAVRRLEEIRLPNSNARNHFHRLTADFMGYEDPFIIGAAVNIYRRNIPDFVHPLPGAVSCLEELGEDFTLTIVTNGDVIDQARKVLLAGLSSHFTSYENGERMNRFYSTDNPQLMKPHPYLWECAHGHIRKYFRDEGTQYSNAVMIEDRLDTGILGANLLGMTTIRVLQGKYARQTIESIFEKNSAQLLPEDRELYLKCLKPDFTCETVGEVPDKIRELVQLGMIQ